MIINIVYSKNVCISAIYLVIVKFYLFDIINLHIIHKLVLEYRSDQYYFLAAI